MIHTTMSIDSENIIIIREVIHITKICPYCHKDINYTATRCPYCTSDIPVYRGSSDNGIFIGIFIFALILFILAGSLKNFVTIIIVGIALFLGCWIFD